MHKEVSHKHVADLESTPSTRHVWVRVLLIAIVAAWTLTMVASLRWRFLDRFVVGTSHGHIGLDFFSTPRAFRNLVSGNNIFLTEIDDYGPHATWFVNHPMVAVAIGSWTAPLPPWIAYGLWVTVSLALLALSARAIACQFEGRLLRAFTLFALFCSLPTYLMLWNAQMHILLILAVAMIFGGLVGMLRDEQGSPRHLRMLQLGVLISLLSKPLVVMILPALFAARETRRALLLPLAAYAAVSALFLLTPGLNSGGYNGAHWLNVLNGSSPKPLYSLVFPCELDLAGSAEIYSLPAYLHRLLGAPVPPIFLKLPVLAILAMSATPFFLSSRRRRMRALTATLMLCILSHFLGYYMVWEYHYATILPMLPVLWWMSQREELAGLRWLLRIALLVLLLNFLPTFYCLAPQTPKRFLAASTLLRVVPVLISFLCILTYGAGNLWAELRAAQNGAQPLCSPSRELVWTGVAVTVSCGIVLASVLSSVPERLTKPLGQWTCMDWTAHVEDMLARPGPGMGPARLAILHCQIGRLYCEANPPLPADTAWHYAKAAALLGELKDTSTQSSNAAEDLATAHFLVGWALQSAGHLPQAIAHYEQALREKPEYVEAHVSLGAALAGRGKVDEAIAHYEEALKVNPDFAAAHYNFANALARRGRVDEAIDHFQKALEISPDYLEAHCNLGTVLAGRGRIEEAVSHYREALKINPDYVPLLKIMARIYATHPDPKFRDGPQAVVLAQRAVELSSGDVEALDALAAAYAEEGQFAEALRTARQGLDVATHENRRALAESLQAKIRRFESGTAYHPSPSSPGNR